ncbi:MAG: FumA C-terminus/TtdB family hydratase beta subunit [bacterium]
MSTSVSSVTSCPGSRSLSLPAAVDDIRALHIGDAVTLTGRMYTGRDAVHRYLTSGETLDCDLRGAVLYHCGPVMVRDGDGWRVSAAGPTTSAREEPYMGELIRRYGLRAVIGKGGMGESTLAAMRDIGCVYLHAVGGAAQVLAANIEEVEAVYGYDLFGPPEAVWQLRVREFPVVVTMDSHGRSLHDMVADTSRQQLELLL